MLKLIFGNSKSGKSSYIYGQMKSDATLQSRSYLIVPEQQTVQCEQALLNLLPPSAQLTAEVLNFSRLANLVFRHYGGLSYNYADKGCKALIMWKTLRELAPLLHEYGDVAAGKRCMSFSAEMLSAVSELKAYGITPERLEEAAERLEGNEILTNKLLDLSYISGAYAASLAESYTDSADDLTKLAEKLSEHDFFAGANVYIDSFTSFTAQEYAVIKQILRSAESVTVALTLDRLSSTQIHYDSTADTAFRLLSLARSMSVDVKQVKLTDTCYLPKPLDLISRGLWQPDLKSIDCGEAIDRISLISVSDPYEEAEAVASVIRRLMMDGVRCRDISVIARDASLYRGIIDVALEKAEIPYFFSQSTDILSKPLIKFLLSALRIKIYNWRAADVISFLKSGLTDFDTGSIDLLECYCTVWRINGGSRFAEQFTMNPDGYSGSLTNAGKESLRRINALRESLVTMLSALFVRLEAADSASEMCRALYLFMEDAAIPAKLSARAESEYAGGRRREAAELLQLYNATVGALENIAISLGDSKCSDSELCDSLRIMLENTPINTIPTAKDQVTVGSASMLRTDGIRCAILIGLNEGEFPQNVKENGIFSNNDKKLLDSLGLSLSPDTSTRSSDELFYVYRAMTTPAERLFLITHEYDLSGAAATPSTAFNRIRAMFPSLRVTRYRDLPDEIRIMYPEAALEKLTALPNTPMGAALRDHARGIDGLSRRVNLSDIPSENRYCRVAPDLSPSPLHLTQTLIDSYVGCPFEYMCRRLLSLKEITPASFDYSSFGTYIHYVFESYLRRAMRDGMIGNPPDAAYISKVVNESADEYLLRSFSGGEADSHRLRYRFVRLRRLAELVATSITKEFADSSFRPEFLELSVGRPHAEPSLAPLIIPTESGKSISLSGKIDRVDIWRRDDGNILVRVVDYKSGKKTFSQNDIEKGENLQLPLYLFALCDSKQSAFSRILGASGDLIPAGAKYLSSLVPTVEVTDSSSILELAENSITRSGFLASDPEVLYAASHSHSQNYLCGVKFGKDGSPSGQALMSDGDMTALREKLVSTVTGIGERIISGDMSCAPSFDGKVCRCERCGMRSVCRASALFMKGL